jgi:hypothetical protein
MNRLENIFACCCAGLLLTAGRGHAETVFWSDNFEINAGNRWTTNSVWLIGSPTFGPANTHSGSKCATTGLKTSAPANADARFICTNYNGDSTLTVPATNQFPRLRFWQWFNFVNAEGYVEIQQSGSTNWQAISATNLSIGGTATYSSGVWSRPSIDLSAFAGQNVQIAFHFTSGGSGWGSDPGWYIDDVAVVTNAPVFNNPESFETGLGDWSVDSGTWEVGKPTSGPATNAAGLRAHSGTNCVATVLAGDYGWNMDARLISPPFFIPASGSPALRYWQWYGFVNAGGFVEINNGTTSSTGITNSTITTNAIFSSLNTNLYQLFGAADAGYSTPFYWNQTIGGWTNATKALGSVFDVTYAAYFFEAGNAPLSLVGQVNNVDYRSTNAPSPRTAAATNFLVWQGMTWNSLTDGNDNPVGYFRTNYSYNYTTNTTVTFAENSWQSILQANNSVGSASVTSGGWTKAAVDLSAYAGQNVQVAFHFQSGGSGWGNASGWYVDDVSLVANPMLTVPTNQAIYAGQTLTATNFVTNSILPNSIFTFSLPSASTNVVITTNGVLTWTNTAALPGTNVIYVTVTDNSVPPLSATNNFSVIILPPASPTLAVSNTLSSSGRFQFTFNTQSNTAWRIDASTNLLNWVPIFTNVAGTSGTLQFTDLLATNFLHRFYRAVSP